ncbi:radical SAM protein [bacterium]|nr:radical SAM protein [Candidatus Elulimicrobium humile]
MAGLYQSIRIQWNFTNHCNFNCEYCPDVLKSGSISLPDPLIFANAFEFVYNKFEIFELSLIGGEPTYFKGLDWALSRLTKNPNKKIILETNGSREKFWWDKFAQLFDQITISYHQNFLQVEHLFLVLETLKEHNVDVLIRLPITPKYWDDTIKVKDMLESKGYHPEIQLLYKNFTKGNNDYYQYSEQHLDFYYKDKQVEEYQISEQIEYKKVHRLNEYHGHMCWAGVDQFVIDKFGDVYRGWCEQGGVLGNIYTDVIKWPEDPIMCQRRLCTNGFDLQARKSENSWGRL